MSFGDVLVVNKKTLVPKLGLTSLLNRDVVFENWGDSLYWALLPKTTKGVQNSLGKSGQKLCWVPTSLGSYIPAK